MERKALNHKAALKIIHFQKTKVKFIKEQVNIEDQCIYQRASKYRGSMERKALNLKAALKIIHFQKTKVKF